MHARGKDTDIDIDTGIDTLLSAEAGKTKKKAKEWWRSVMINIIVLQRSGEPKVGGEVSLSVWKPGVYPNPETQSSARASSQTPS